MTNFQLFFDMSKLFVVILFNTMNPVQRQLTQGFKTFTVYILDTACPLEIRLYWAVKMLFFWLPGQK